MLHQIIAGEQLIVALGKPSTTLSDVLDFMEQHSERLTIRGFYFHDDIEYDTQKSHRFWVFRFNRPS